MPTAIPILASTLASIASLAPAQGALERVGIGWTGVWIVALVLVALSLVLVLATRYKRCPSNRILVIYGKTRAGQAAKCIHGGGAFVVPLIQSFDYLELDPIQIETPLKGALSAENIRVNVPSFFTVAIEPIRSRCRTRPSVCSASNRPR